jgi:hypothetical protein
LTVAFVVGGTAVATAAALLVGLSSRASAIEMAAASADRAANAERLMRLLTANLDESIQTARLEGYNEHVVLRTLCETAAGWLEPCRVQLDFRKDGESGLLMLQARFDTADRSAAKVHEIVLRSGVLSGEFLYLVDAADGGTWAESWTSLTLPRAVGIVVDGDTLLLPVR